MIIIGLSKVLLFPFFRSNNSSDSTEFGATDLNHYLEGMSAQIEPDGELEHELKIMQNALELGNIKARDCMVPRNEVVSISLDSSISDIKEIFNNTGLSKIVAFDGDIDKNHRLYTRKGSFSNCLKISVMFYCLPSLSQNL